MVNLTFSYDDNELAWVSEEAEINNNFFLLVRLLQPGKIVIRQFDNKKKWVRLPIESHNSNREFNFRVRLIVPSAKIKIFTSTEPKVIKYAYI